MWSRSASSGAFLQSADEFGNPIYASIFGAQYNSNALPDVSACPRRLRRRWTATGAPDANNVAAHAAPCEPFDDVDDRGSRNNVSASNACERSGVSEESLPWHLRSVRDRDTTQALGLLRSDHFWSKTEFSLRSTCLAFIPCVALVTSDATKEWFLGQSFVLLGSFVGSAPTLGFGLEFTSFFVKGALFWVPFCTLLIYIRLWESPAAWNITYVLSCLAICLVGRGYTSKLCLVFFGICMLAMFVAASAPPQQKTPAPLTITFPAKALLELLIGTALGLCSVCLPFKRMSTCIVDMTLEKKVLLEFLECLPNVHRAFWAANTTERNVMARRLHVAVGVIEASMASMKYHLHLAEYEMFVLGAAGVRRQQVRRLVLRGCESLLYRLTCLARVVELMRELQVLLVGQTEAHQRECDALRSALDDLTNDMCNAMATLLCVGKCGEAEDVARGMSVLTVRHKLTHVEACMGAFRTELFHHVDFRQNERLLSLLGFYLFAVKSFVETLEVISTSLICSHAEDDVPNRSDAESSSKTRLSVADECRDFVLGSIADAWHRVRSYFPVRTEKDLRAVVEAVKVSCSMFASLRFFMLIVPDVSLLSGPTIIAFCAGDTFGYALNGAFIRLCGVMFGSVIGYFADSYARTPVEKAIALCCIYFGCNWFRDGRKYGNTAEYALFNALSMVALQSTRPQPADTLTATVQQNTFAVMIYCGVALLVWPPKPMAALRLRRSKTLAAIQQTFFAVLDLFSAPIVSASQLPSPSAQAPLNAERVNDNGVSLPFHARLQRTRALLVEARRRLSKEAALLDIVEDEPVCAPVFFPAALNRDIHSAEKKLILMLDVCIGAWSLLEPHTATPRPTLQRFLMSLAPVALDVAVVSEGTMNVIREMLLNPFADLMSDLMTEGAKYVRVSNELYRRMATGFAHIVVSQQGKLATGLRLASGVDDVASPMHLLTPSASSADHRILSVSNQREVYYNSSMTIREQTVAETLPLLQPSSIGEVVFTFPTQALGASSPVPVASCGDHEELVESTENLFDTQLDTQLGLVPMTKDDVLALHSLRYALITYVDHYRSVALAVHDMHHFDAASNWKLFSYSEV